MKDSIAKLIDAALGVQELVERYNRHGDLINTALGDVLDERHRQIEEHGFDADHDDHHPGGELALAGAAYLMNAACNLFPAFTEGSGSSCGQPSLLRSVLYPHYSEGDSTPPVFWTWNKKYWKPKTPREDLVRAAALILAEIERLDRAEARHA